MWQKHMCSAWVQSLLKHTVLLPPVRHHFSLSLEQRNAQKERVREGATSCARLKYWGRMFTPRERKPAQSNHISINQLSSKVNRGLIREDSAEHLLYSVYSPLPGMSVSVTCLAELWLRRQKHGTQAAISHPSISVARTQNQWI